MKNIKKQLKKHNLRMGRGVGGVVRAVVGTVVGTLAELVGTPRVGPPVCPQISGPETLVSTALVGA